jgi:beta-N-acetylhexosaminidase
LVQHAEGKISQVRLSPNLPSAAIRVAVTAAVLAAAPMVVGPAPAGSDPAPSVDTATVTAETLTSERVARTAETVLAGMSLRQRVGQLFMVGTPATAASTATKSHITHRHVGNVMLTGRSFGGVRTPARVSAAMQARATRAATKRVRLLVATDQEGGLVQVLNGAGMTDMPSALTQGRWAPSRLRARAGRWARQLHRAGVNMNLAPVVDTVPSPAAAQSNPPIGAFDRQFGYRPEVVASHGRAFVQGMSRNRVVPTIKHFPGLGRVHGNTDTTAGVTDRVTRRHDPYLRPFKVAIDAGSPFVMMSTAYYARMDRRNPAAFSQFIIGQVLRGDLGFHGVVISDDLASARQVSRWTYGQRAVKFVRAGGNVVLTVDPRTLPAMYRAVLTAAHTRESFRHKVDQSALRILRLKEDRGLL